MNTERILKLADVIEESETYDQTQFFHPCGTPGCIAGHAVTMLGSDEKGPNTSEIAREELGLDEVQATALFFVWPFTINPTAKQAATVLRHLARTGEVDWEVAA